MSPTTDHTAGPSPLACATAVPAAGDATGAALVGDDETVVGVTMDQLTTTLVDADEAVPGDDVTADADVVVTTTGVEGAVGDAGGGATGDAGATVTTTSAAGALDPDAVDVVVNVVAVAAAAAAVVVVDVVADVAGTAAVTGFGLAAAARMGGRKGLASGTPQLKHGNTHGHGAAE